MSLSLLTPFNLQELIEFKNPSLATTPPFTAFVENGLTRVVYAFLALDVAGAGILRIATSPTACRVIGDGE